MRIPLGWKLLAGVALLSMAGCSCGKSDGALQVVIDLDATVSGTCVVLEVRDDAGVRLSQDLVRSSGKDAFHVGLKQGELPANVTLIARSFASKAGSGCSEPRVLTSASTTVMATFPISGVETATLQIHAPPASLDADGDLHVDAAKGGDDCNDADAAIHPGAAADCGSSVDNDCDGQAGCADSECSGLASCTSKPVSLAFVTTATPAPQGSCSAALTVELRDSTQNPAPAPAGTQVGLAAAPAVATFFSDSACTQAATSVAFVTGQARATFYFKATAAGAFDAQATVAGLPTATQAQTVTGPVASKLAFTTPPRTVLAGDCSQPLTLQTQDSSGAPLALTAAATASLGADRSGVSFFSDAACATALAGSALPFTAGNSSSTFYVKATSAQATVLTATLGSFVPVTQNLSVTAGNPSKLVFATAPQGPQAGACSGVVTVQTRDANDNVAPVSAVTPVGLATTGVALSFFSDAACTTALVLPLDIAAGTPSASFYFVGNTPGVATVTASASGLTSAVQMESVGAGPPAKLAFLTAPQTTVAGQCSAVATVQVQDASSIPSNVTGAPLGVTFTPPGASVTLYSDVGCVTALAGPVSIAVGNNSASVYFKGTLAGAQALTAAASGLTSALQTETVTAAAPTVLVFTSAPQTHVAGFCAQFDLEARDTFGNPSAPAAAATVNLTTVGAATFSAAAGCAAPATSVSLTGTTVSFFASASLAGSKDFTATAPFASAGQTYTVTAAAASVLAVSTPVRTLSAGGCSQVVTLEARDSFGNPSAPAADVAIALTDSGAADFVFHGAAGCGGAVSAVTLLGGQTTVPVFFTATKAASVTMTFTPVGLSVASQLAQVIATSASKLVFTTPIRTADSGACSSVLTVERRDTFDNVAIGAAFSAGLATSSVSPGFKFFPDAACTPAGATTALPFALDVSSADFYFSGTLAEPMTLTVSATGLADALQGATVTAAGPSKLAILGAPQTVTAGVCSALITVERRDLNDNPASPASTTPVGLTSTGSSGFGFYSDAACTLPISAVTIASLATQAGFYFSGTKAELLTITGSSAGLTPGAQGEGIKAGPPSVLAISTPARVIDALSCVPSASTVETRDGFGNASVVAADLTVGLAGTPGGLTARFYDTAACSGLTTSVVVPMNTAQGSFYFDAQNAGTLTITASAATYTSGTQDETINPAQPTHLVLGATTSPAEAGACAAVRVTRQDALNRDAVPASATAVTLDVSPLTGMQLFSDSACTVGAAGVSILSGTAFTDFYVKGTTGGTYALTASATGLTSSTPLNFVVLPMVRRGSCVLANTTATVTCPVSPAIPADDITRTFLLFQAAGVAATPTDDNVVCRLTTGAGVNVVCDRQGTAGNIDVTWQTVSSAKTFAGGGITVQHLSGLFTATPTNSVTVTSVDLTKSIVLFSYSSTGGTNGEDDLHTAKLTTATNVDITSNANLLAGRWAVQVVSFAGSNVLRGTTSGGGAAVSVPALAVADVTRTFALHSARTSGNDTVDICKRRLRGVVASATSLNFSRGDPTPPAACIDAAVNVLEWERIELAAGLVQQPTLLHASNALTGNVALTTAVDLTRTVVFMSGQGIGGQAAGESNFTGNDVVAAVLGSPSLNPAGNLVTVTRQAVNLGTATFSPFVVQFVP